MQNGHKYVISIRKVRSFYLLLHSIKEAESDFKGAQLHFPIREKGSWWSIAEADVPVWSSATHSRWTGQRWGSGPDPCGFCHRDLSSAHNNNRRRVDFEAREFKLNVQVSAFRLTEANLWPKLIHSFSISTCRHTADVSVGLSRRVKAPERLWPGSLSECGSDCPAWAWRATSAEPFDPSRRCSAPPPSSRRTLCLPPGSPPTAPAAPGQDSVRRSRNPETVGWVWLLPWCVPASVWTPGWTASGTPPRWGRRCL